MKYRVYGIVTGTKFLGEYEANSEEEAKDKAANDAQVNLCHQCDSECDGAEIYELTVEKAE